MSDEGRTLPSYPDGSSVSEDAFRQRYLDAKFRTFNAQNGDAAPTRYTTFVRALKDIDQSEGSDSNQELLPLRVIKKGDVIEVVQRFSGEKWFGSLGSAFGFFPVNTGDVVRLYPRYDAIYDHDAEAIIPETNGDRSGSSNMEFVV